MAALGTLARDLISEPHVETCAENTGRERHIAGGREPAIEAAIEAAEVEIEILGLDAHVAHNAHLDAAAHRPSGPGDTAGRKSGHGRVDVAHRKPRCQIRKKAVERVAHPASDVREPIVAGRVDFFIIIR